MGHIPQPLNTGVLVGRVWLAGSDIDLARHGLVDDGLFLLLQKLDQPFLGKDVTPDAPFGMVEEADDGGLLGEGRNWKVSRTGKFFVIYVLSLPNSGNKQRQVMDVRSRT